MRNVLSYILIAIGLILPFYFLISGIMQVVYGISPFVATEIIIGVVKILFCGIGVVPAYIGTLLLEYKKITK